VDALKERIVRSDGLLIATPEYNNSMPGVAKNVIDWLSRPPDDADRVFKNLPVAVMGTSPGRFGTVLAQNAWLSVFRTLEMTPYFGDRVALPQAARLFDEHLTIADELIRGVLRHFIHGFFSFAAQHKGRRP
jgi:NAD(P)H-dependent FMN reductase